jgi:hypothetical protein
LVKKSLLHPNPVYPKPTNTYTNTTIPTKPNPTQPRPLPANQPNKPLPIKPREPGECWGCQEPWTPEHKFNYKFRRAVNAMDMSPENWLVVEQVMEDENHVLLQAETSEPAMQQPPQLLLISSHVVNGTSSAATFSLVIIIGGKRGVALVDSGSTDTFIDYSFASQCHCPIISTKSRAIKVAGGGTLDSNATTGSVQYTIQKEAFTGEFKMLVLRGYDVILACDWIKQHSPIGIDLRDSSQELIIMKEGQHKVTFRDFTALPLKPEISAHQLEKLCRADFMGYIIQINALY